MISIDAGSLEDTGNGKHRMFYGCVLFHAFIFDF